MFTLSGDRGTSLVFWTLVVLVIIVGLVLVGYLYHEMEESQGPCKHIYHYQSAADDAQAFQLYNDLIRKYEGSNVDIYMTINTQLKPRFYYCGSRFRPQPCGYPDFDVSQGWTLESLSRYIDHYVNLKNKD